MDLLEKQKNEAIKRMEKLNIMPEIIKDFENKGKVATGIEGANYFIDEYQKNFEKFEEEYKGLVYYSVLNKTEFGMLLSIFYVSETTSEWKLDRGDLKENIAMVYVENLDDPYCSEFGSIGVRSQFGGVVRTA